MENMTKSGYTVGDQLSGGPAADQPPNLPVFLDTIEAIASFNSRFVNKAHGEWEGHSLEQWVMGMENEFLHMMWPGMSKAVAATAPQILEDGGILKKDDPFWKSIDNFCDLQVDFYNSFSQIDCHLRFVALYVSLTLQVSILQRSRRRAACTLLPSRMAM